MAVRRHVLALVRLARGFRDAGASFASVETDHLPLDDALVFGFDRHLARGPDVECAGANDFISVSDGRRAARLNYRMFHSFRPFFRGLSHEAMIRAGNDV